MNYLKHSILIAFVVLTSGYSLLAQSGYKRAMLEKLERSGMIYLEPLENSFRSIGSGSIRYFDYDIRLRSKDSKEEIFIIVQSYDQDSSRIKIPHIELTRFIASCASNDQQFDIRMINLSKSELETHGASWGARAEFVLKSGISKYPYAQLMCLYKEGHGLVMILQSSWDDESVLKEIVTFNTTKDEME